MQGVYFFLNVGSSSFFFHFLQGKWKQKHVIRVFNLCFKYELSHGSFLNHKHKGLVITVLYFDM